MNEEFIKEYIRAKRTPVSSCVDLSKYFIGRHKVLPVYLTPQFEREFNSKMCELEKIKEKLELSEKARKEAVELVKYSSLEINTREYGQLTVVNSDDVLNILDIDKGEMKDE